MISFSIDWFDLLTVQGTHKRLLLYHSSKASILQHSASFVENQPLRLMALEELDAFYTLFLE